MGLILGDERWGTFYSEEGIFEATPKKQKAIRRNDGRTKEELSGKNEGEESEEITKNSTETKNKIKFVI